MWKTDLVTTPSKEDWNRSVLTEALVYQSKRAGKMITVPQGFSTDFASVPRLAQLFVPKMGRHRAAATLHDYLYSTKSRVRLTRKQADDIFLDAMKDSRVNWFVRHTMHKTVRVFGGFYYKKARQ